MGLAADSSELVCKTNEGGCCTTEISVGMGSEGGAVMNEQQDPYFFHIWGIISISLCFIPIVQGLYSTDKRTTIYKHKGATGGV